MRKTPPTLLEQGRFWGGHYASKPGDMYGVFHLADMLIMSSGVDRKYGWEHVSVSREDRPPTWAEMCFVKDLFWSEDECVVQYHPAQKDYVNYHPHCLHLWRPLRKPMPTPPTILIGPKE